MRSSKAFFFSVALVTTLLALFFVKVKEDPFLHKQVNKLVYNPYRAGPPSELINIQITIADQEDASKGRIESVTFNGKPIDLQPPNPTRLRATIYPQIPPGQYEIAWTVRKDYSAWPQTITHNKEISITTQDQWMEILIEGDQLNIR